MLKYTLDYEARYRNKKYNTNCLQKLKEYVSKIDKQDINFLSVSITLNCIQPIKYTLNMYVISFSLVRDNLSNYLTYSTLFKNYHNISIDRYYDEDKMIEITKDCLNLICLSTIEEFLIKNIKNNLVGIEQELIKKKRQKDDYLNLLKEIKNNLE